MKSLIFFLCGLVAYAPQAWTQGYGTFAPTGKLLQPRSSHTTTLLQDGRVLISGGCGNATVLVIDCPAEIYDPATGSFRATAKLITARNNHAAVRLLDGRVLIAGGYVPNGAAGRAELFDPSKETFEPAGVMVEATANNSAVLLQDGRVLLLGGRN